MKKYLFLITLFIPLFIRAGIPQPLKDTYVNDFAHVLSSDQIAALNEGIYQLEKKNNVQLAIVLVDTIPKDNNIIDFARLIGRSWHVGNNGRGVVYVAAISQRQQRIEVASELRNVLTQERCEAIMSDMKSYLRDKDYGDGLQALISELNTVLTATPDTRRVLVWMAVMMSLIVLLIIVLVIWTRKHPNYQINDHIHTSVHYPISIVNYDGGVIDDSGNDGASDDGSFSDSGFSDSGDSSDSGGSSDW